MTEKSRFQQSAVLYGDAMEALGYLVGMAGDDRLAEQQAEYVRRALVDQCKMNYLLET